MKNGSLVNESLVQIRQKQTSYQIEDFVIEFLGIWDAIHSQAPNLSLSDIKDFSESILDSITLPFYHKFKTLKCIEKYDPWLKSLSSIVINWSEMGRIMFPLRLIIYEVVNHEEGLFDFFLKQILTKSMKGTAENLFGMLFPKLINVAIPLSEVDILYLKSLQVLQNSSSDIFRGANIKDFSTHLDKSTRTVLRRIKLIEFFQIDIPMHFLDMAKLGYETFLLSHFQPVPDNLTPYCYNSVDLSISQFSLFQVPVSKPNVFMQIQNDLEPIIFQQMDTRIQNWNLSGLGVGKDGWKIPPSFLYSDPSLQIITASPAMEVSLRPDLETFRKLTPADIKILEFITTTGALRTRKDLSQAVKVSSPQISHRLDEYLEERLIFKIHQFFNIGLDLTISFCITCPDSYNIAWIPHFLSFPKVDIFFSKDEQGNMFFGHVKLPPKWIKDFILKVRMLKQEFKALKFYYTAEPPTIGKWSTSLSDTYF